MAIKPDNMFDEKAAGIYLGGAESPISTRTLQRWCWEGSGPEYVKLGRLVRYQQSALDRHLESRSVNSTSEISS